MVGPTTGGVLLAFETARHLQERLGHTVRGIFAEPVGPGQRALRRGWPVRGDDRIVLVDDILTSGASVRETVDAVAAAGGRPLAATVIVDRSVDAVDVGVPLGALARIEIASGRPTAARCAPPASHCEKPALEQLAGAPELARSSATASRRRLLLGPPPTPLPGRTKPSSRGSAPAT